MAAKRPDFKKSSSCSLEFNQEQVKRASELAQTEHVGVQSDTNVVKGVASSEQNSHLSTTERKKGVLLCDLRLACADRDARFPAHEKQRRFENRSVLVFAVRVARVTARARAEADLIFSFTHVCSFVFRSFFFSRWKS